MVKFLNERGFRRIVKAIKNALNLKADKTELPLVVNFDEDTNTCDTSITDIIAAYNTGRVVEMKFGLQAIPLVAISEGYAAFSIKINATGAVNIEGTIENGSDVWSQKADTLTFDYTPTTGSQNPVTSGGVKTALDTKADKVIELMEVPGFMAALAATSDNPATLTTAQETELNSVVEKIKAKNLVALNGALVNIDLNSITWVETASYGQLTFRYTQDNTYVNCTIERHKENGTWKYYSNVNTAMHELQAKLVSGTNIKTINNNSLLGSGNVDLGGDDILYSGKGKYVLENAVNSSIDNALDDLDNAIHELGTPNEIASITTSESSASGGNNTVTITETNGTSHTFNVKNGVDGQDGADGADGVSLGEIALVQTTGNATDAVMSQKAVSDYTRKVTAEDLAGTSDWIKARLTEEGWVFGKYVYSNGTLASNSSYCASPFIPISDIKGHSITISYMYNAWATSCFCFYDSSKAYISGLYYTVNINNVRTVTIGTSATWDNVAYIRITCNPNKLSECYIKDNTTGEIIWNGADNISVISEDNNLSLKFFCDTFVAQESGNNTLKVMSQKAVTDAIEDNPIRKSTFTSYHVFENAQSCFSVDTFNADEIKCMSSVWVSDGFAGNISNYNYQLKHIFGIVSPTNPENDYFSFYCESYNLYLRLRKNGSNVLNYSLGSSSSVYIQRMFTMFDFYGKKVSIYIRDSSGNIITLLDKYDFSELDLSNLQNFKIATSLGTSYNNKTMFNHVWINNYILNPTAQLNRVVYFGQYNPIGSYALKTKPNEPSSYKFTNEGSQKGITITLNDPYHKIVTVDRDTAGLVYQWGFYAMNNVPSVYQSYTYEICKIKFTNVTSNLLMRGWSENGGSNYILDPATYVYTKIPMDSNTGTVLEYPIEEGKTYYLIYALGSGYSTRYNHYIGGHFTMEITEPKIYCLGSMNLHAECYDGKYFCGHIPFMSEGNFVPAYYGQFGTIDSPNLTGRIRIKSGNIQVYNGSVWKQINNS